MLHADRLASAPAGPLVIYLNHPSWWDPVVCAELARRLLRGRAHRAPISAEALKRYRFFRHIGMFPVEQNALRGAAHFLRVSQGVLQAGGVLWITAQGHFHDARVRPARLMPGLGALLRRTAGATVIPLAVEYTFWNQRMPEVLLCAGESLRVNGADQHSSPEWTALLESRLQAAQDELAVASMRRDPSEFMTLLEGRSGTGGPYGLWQRALASLRGERYRPDHQVNGEKDL